MKDLRPESRFPVNTGRLVGDISRAFNPLRRDSLLDVQVSERRDGFVFLNVALPEGMTRAFLTLLESMTGLVRFVDHKARCAAAEDKAIDPDEIEERRAYYENYRAEVCELFNRFTASGLDRKEAVKRTAAALRSKNHPWSAFHLVEQELRKAGRLRRGRPTAKK